MEKICSGVYRLSDAVSAKVFNYFHCDRCIRFDVCKHYNAQFYEFVYIYTKLSSFRDINDFDILQTNLRIDYKMALEMTYGILILEAIHRVIVCFFEVRRISKNSNHGKSIMQMVCLIFFFL